MSLKKYIYHDKTVRCKITIYRDYPTDYELKIQKRNFFFLWIDVFKTLYLSEGFWGESHIPILYWANDHEAYRTGTLDIPKRVNEFFKDYFHSRIKEEATVNKLKALS